MRTLIEGYGVPHYLPVHEQWAMRIGSWASRLFPRWVVPAVIARMRWESRDVILPGHPNKLLRHLEKRRKSGFRMNLNQLGEAVLGEMEAAHRLDQAEALLRSRHCDYVSVKLSALFSQIHLVAYEETLAEVKIRLRRLYRAALAERPHFSPGRHKFVNLDMEEYRDLALTCEAFREVLSESEFRDLEAGIVLQAYLPDAHQWQRVLTEWAGERVDQGGAGIKVRIVKGANLAMERVDAEIHGWPLAPYDSKIETDASYKRMLDFAFQSEHCAAVRIGVASHNLFDIAWAALLAAARGVEDRVEFEMLEGMANHQARVVRDLTGGLLFYAPFVRREEYHASIAYLVRRLDENTTPENFLHDLFGMMPGNAAWKAQEERFLAAARERTEVFDFPRRLQNRRAESDSWEADISFANTPDTDWSLRQNQLWIRERVEAQREARIEPIPLQIGGGNLLPNTDGIGVDPSRPEIEVRYRFALAGLGEIDRALEVSSKAQPDWESRGRLGRCRILKQCAAKLAERRGEFIATMVLDAGKAVMEGDAEVSEVIDFARYYAESFDEADGWTDGVEMRALGTVVVTPPWNFPLAIPGGGVLAAMMAGNAVILKSAPETVLTAWRLANALWDAGVPREVLQFLPCPDNEIGRSLITDDRVGGVILTGALATARMFLGWKPGLRLFAETSGKDAIIITAAADPDQAVKDLVKSAFGHSGQKCSAASLAIVEAERYDDPNFQRQLRDAAASLRVASAWDFSSVITPVIRLPGPELERGLTRLDPGESWLLEPVQDADNPCLWSPGIRIGVAPGSWFHLTECFGPVLGVIRADDLDHAIAIQNASPFGLTGGIQSLDEKEIARWKDQVEVGNGYINRGITGAIVRRQPFGGWKRSAVGPGAKAGGPNYVAMLARWKETLLPNDLGLPEVKVLDWLGRFESILPDSRSRLRAAAGSQALWWRNEFSREHDPSALVAESNVYRYRPHQRVLLRVTDRPENLAICLLAARVAGVPAEISMPQEASERFRRLADAASVDVMFESEERLASRLLTEREEVGVLRITIATTGILQAAHQTGWIPIDWPVLANGRLELRHYLREQSLAETSHRYGNHISKPADLKARPA